MISNLLPNTHFLLLAILPLLPALVLDICLGDPRWLYHPVRVIGAFISFSEKQIRKIIPKTSAWELAGGAILALVIPVFFFCLTWAVLAVVWKINGVAALVLEVFLCYQMLALKSLKTESDRVKKALLEDDLDSARKWLSYIVGRDTAQLSKEEIIKATVETVAENTSDGVIAPMCYMGIFGAPLVYFYKSVNTLDSMVGYLNSKYKYFGRACAKLDDICNYLPARLSGVFMVVAAFLSKLDYKNAWRIFLRDRHNHPSPNSGQTEAACAGALQIQLGGGSYYGGIYKEKQTIGDHIKTPEISDIQGAQKLLFVSSLVASVVITLFRLVVFYWLGR